MSGSVTKCGVCGAKPFARGLCTRCYQRARRGLPPSVEPKKAREEQVTFRIDAADLKKVKALAKREGIKAAEFFRRALADRIVRQEKSTSKRKGS